MTAAPVEADPTPTPILAAWALGGSALTGAAFGLTIAADTIPRTVLPAAWPATIFGVTLLCAPTLYIAAAFAGVAPDPRRTARAFAETLGAVGRLLVGCLPAVAFLAATYGRGAIFLSFAMLAFAAWVGLRGLYRRVFGADGRLRTRALYLGWSAVYLAIGLYTYVSLLAA